MNAELFHVHGKTRCYKTVNSIQIIKSFAKIIKFANVKGRYGYGHGADMCC